MRDAGAIKQAQFVQHLSAGFEHAVDLRAQALKHS